MPTMGASSGLPPIEPWKAASPKEKMPAVGRHLPVPATVGGRRCANQRQVGSDRWPRNRRVPERVARADLGAVGRPGTADGNEGVSHRPELGDDLREGRDRLGSITTSVVHIDDRTGERGADHPVHDRLHAGEGPVLRVHGVAHGRQPS